MKITLNREVGTLLLDIKGETEMSITKVLQEALMMYQEHLIVEKLFIGRDIYMQAEEIVERLQKKYQLEESEQEDCQGNCESCECCDCNSESPSPKRMQMPRDWDKD